MKRILPILVILLVTALGAAGPASAGSYERQYGGGYGDYDGGKGKGHWRDRDRGKGHGGWRNGHGGWRHGHRDWGRGYGQRPWSRVIVKPVRHNHYYRGYGHSHGDQGFFGLFAFTALTLGVLDLVNDSQQRAHEAAYLRATRAPVGETIHWQDGGASGAVTPTREGTSTAGRYCREFQQSVTIGGRTEQSYGTACMQPDGSWEIVSTR